MSMATKRARACVRVSQATRRLERMVTDHNPDRVSQRSTILEYASRTHTQAVQLRMWRTAERVLQLLDQLPLREMAYNRGALNPKPEEG